MASHDQFDAAPGVAPNVVPVATQVGVAPDVVHTVAPVAAPVAAQVGATPDVVPAATLVAAPHAARRVARGGARAAAHGVP